MAARRRCRRVGPVVPVVRGRPQTRTLIVTEIDEALRAELLRRVEKDQVARKAHDVDGMREADAENLPWLKAVVARRGWPGASVVGTDGANGAWLLAQHADADPAFQRRCLGLL